MCLFTGRRVGSRTSPKGTTSAAPVGRWGPGRGHPAPRHPPGYPARERAPPTPPPSRPPSPLAKLNSPFTDDNVGPIYVRSPIARESSFDDVMTGRCHGIRIGQILADYLVGTKRTALLFSKSISFFFSRQTLPFLPPGVWLSRKQSIHPAAPGERGLISGDEPLPSPHRRRYTRD